MTIDLPYYTGMLLIGGLVFVSVVYIIAKAIVELDKKKK